MERQAANNEIPKWSALLVEAVNKPGLVMEAYSAFHHRGELIATVRQYRKKAPKRFSVLPIKFSALDD